MKILGLNLTRTSDGRPLDDGASALLVDGVPVVGIAEERLTRRKHSPGVARSVQYCLSAAKADLAEIDHVVVSNCCDTPATAETASALLRDEGLDIGPDQITVCPSHHLSHAASAFFASPFGASLSVVADHEGNIIGPRTHPDYWRNRVERTSAFRCHRTAGGNGGVAISPSRRYAAGPDVLGLGSAYAYVTRWLGLGRYHEAGQTMALAAFGRGSLSGVELFRQVDGEIVSAIAQRNDDKPSAVGDWLRAEVGRNGQQAEWPSVGTPGFPDRGFPDCAQPVDLQHEVAHVAQRSLEQTLVQIVRDNITEVGYDAVCLAGGVALNCVANGRLARELGPGRLFVQPASSDVGQGLGNALWAHHHLTSEPFEWTMTHAFLGRQYSPDEIRAALGRHSDTISACQLTDVADVAAEVIANGAIVGWFQGGSELGPRALGHRSILADPRTPQAKIRLDTSIKRRAAFRPYAPAVPVEHAGDWFDVEPAELAQAGSPLDFMLMSVPVRPDVRDLVPSVVHVDGSARAQVVRPDVDPLFHALLTSFGRRTSVPVLLNTSFNPAGEPIVESPDDAVNAFLRMGLDYLFIGEMMVTRRA
ncbi:carbamoyltransferase family protein [Saccharopolyspora sp. 5N708]|uniref:carbamoyltransferase family protein n=1 Tax=Saccharopolyspora sp. 5N708 TaxID=3457424 RepID=UPI003FD61A9B